ncbi:hypothetical protein DPMN_173484 [Dreissena polymorpha]|uniref:Uncharacterized protein n=1 Tax=Dreissena polymorpha TaxID=45954 RepID=A0A9D4E2Y1_DREPO|nr:hypothetical protein DPMN_173484 [Dreissena polymorpha]
MSHVNFPSRNPNIYERTRDWFRAASEERCIHEDIVVLPTLLEANLASARK